MVIYNIIIIGGLAFSLRCPQWFSHVTPSFSVRWDCHDRCHVRYSRTAATVLMQVFVQGAWGVIAHHDRGVARRYQGVYPRRNQPAR